MAKVDTDATCLAPDSIPFRGSEQPHVGAAEPRSAGEIIRSEGPIPYPVTGGTTILYLVYQEFYTPCKKFKTFKGSSNQTAVLIYDGHASHISVRIVEEAMSNNITLIKLPSHLTDMLQPLDKCVFGPVKTFWEKKLIAFGKKQMGKGTGRLSKPEFVELLAEVWTHAIKPTNIVSGFRSCGIFPVDKTKFPTSSFKQRELEEYLQKQENSIDTPEGISLGIPEDHHNESIRQEVRVVTPPTLRQEVRVVTPPTLRQEVRVVTPPSLRKEARV
ncbi:hypothetical protein NQ315_016211, partial [Exocentrus adspersus]